MVGSQGNLARASEDHGLYIPLEAVRIRNSGRSRSTKVETRPQFPGYGFCPTATTTSALLDVLRERYHLAPLRGWDHRVQFATELEVQQAMIYEAESRLQVTAPPPPPPTREWVRVGDWVSVQVGAHGSIEGVVLKIERGTAHIHREGWPLTVQAHVRSLVKIDANT